MHTDMATTVRRIVRPLCGGVMAVVGVQRERLFAEATGERLGFGNSLGHGCHTFMGVGV